MNRLNYEIFFIENETSFVNGTALHIRKFLDKYGFNTKITQKKGKDLNITEINDSIDLIILDLNLNNSIQGSDLIPKIRDNKIVADILFYSDDLTKYDEKLKTLGNLDGVYFFRGRKGLTQKIISLIHKSIKKHQTVSNLRGLVISEAIDLEAKMSKIIIKFFGLLDHPREDLFFEKILDPEVFMLGKKAGLINSICKKLKEELSKKTEGAKKGEKEKEKKLIIDINKIHDTCSKAEDEIVKIRNVLSHVQPSKDNPNVLITKVKGYETIEINEDWCIKTRKNLLKHSENLDNLMNKIYV